MIRYNKYYEGVPQDILQDMRYFGLGKNDIDSDGYVTLFHGGKSLPQRLKKNEIFFMTSSEVEAQDYANMRKGKVYTLKVKPEDVNWNQGSGEVEFSKGGKIIKGIIYPYERKKAVKINKKNRENYKGIKVGDVMPKTKWKVLDLVIHANGKAQFQFEKGWYDADAVINYEFKNE